MNAARKPHSNATAYVRVFQIGLGRLATASTGSSLSLVCKLNEPIFNHVKPPQQS